MKLSNCFAFTPTPLVNNLQYDEMIKQCLSVWFQSSIRAKGHIGTKNYKKLQRNVKLIKRNLSVEDVLDDLISKEVLSIEDGISIRDKRVNHEMADSLIQKLIFVGKDGFEIFEGVLRDNGYGYMIEQGKL